MADGLDWETVRSKYDGIRAKFLASYPNEEKSEAFPNSKNKEEFSKDRLTAKLNQIKTSFRKAVDSGRKSGGGRVVFALYDECCEVWAGCPAAESLADGLEATTIEQDVSSIDDEYTDLDLSSSTPSPCPSEQNKKTSKNQQQQASAEQKTDLVEPAKKKIRVERENLEKFLNERRNIKSNGSFPRKDFKDLP